MAVIHPFRSIRPARGAESEVAAVPYDVVNRDEARSIGEASPSSFLHVTRPEIDLPESVDEHDPRTYSAGAAALRRFLDTGLLVEDELPSLFLYRLSEGLRAQTGIVACCEVAEYESGLIKRHELTRPEKEDDRVAHIEALGCHTGPVLMTYRSRKRLADLIALATRTAPIFEFTAGDAVTHTGWRIEEPAPFVSELSAVDEIYIADGHHRAAAAARVAAAERTTVEAGRFLSVLFPDVQMRILAYNRHVSIDAAERARVIAEIARRFHVTDHPDGRPARAGTVCLSDGRRWKSFELPPSDSSDPAARLDLARLASLVFEPILGIVDQRRDRRIEFVGGKGSVARLAELVDRAGGIAFSLHPVSVGELIAVSDAGLLMPPKSTWFEPKLRSGLFVHRFR